MRRQLDEQRKVCNDHVSQLATLKFELVEKTEDLEEALSKLNEKDERLRDAKDISQRQNQQIEDLRRELTENMSKQKIQLDQLRKKNLELQQSIESLQGNGGASKEAMDAKTKEVYALTVELGSLREENNELKKTIEMKDQDFQERLEEQRARANTDYDELQRELEVLQLRLDREMKDKDK